MHHLLTVVPGDRIGVVATLAGGGNRSLVFTSTKHAPHQLVRHLASGGAPAADLRGNLAQNVRERNLAWFASGAVRVMVGTDIAARGTAVLRPGAVYWGADRCGAAEAGNGGPAAAADVGRGEDGGEAAVPANDGPGAGDAAVGGVADRGEGHCEFAA